MNEFVEMIKKRRSIYDITAESTITDAELIQLLEEIVLSSPSAFNSQSATIALLLGDSHQRLWDITKETLRREVSAEDFLKTEERINKNAAGYGTILFFDDTKITNSLANSMPEYKEEFPNWADQTSAMLQFAVWTALEVEGMGASLHHYNPLIDEEVKRVFEIPLFWRLIGQMPFGKIVKMPEERKITQSNIRLTVINKE